jgi:hypothetical protein
MDDSLPHPPLKLFIARNFVRNVHFYHIHAFIATICTSLALSTWMVLSSPHPSPNLPLTSWRTMGTLGRRPLL